MKIEEASLTENYCIIIKGEFHNDGHLFLRNVRECVRWNIQFHIFLMFKFIVNIQSDKRTNADYKMIQ